MTAKTIMMAVAAAMGLAASAGVIEVKFTVKTDVNNKVASKVISGLYDQGTGKHVFWTREKSVNVPVQNAYFGLVNDTTVAKKVGQNAELIWGDEKNPENVLVAGAWGSDKSKSGQVAGTFNGKPATGTWSAKLNTKKSYEDLLAKNKVTQTENREQGVIAQGKADVAAAEQKADDEIAAAKAEAEAAVKAAEEKAAAEIAAAKAEADKALDAKKVELDTAAEMMKTLAKAFETIDDPDMPNMFSDYIADTKAKANTLTNEAQSVIADAEAKYDAYATALDADALKAKVEEAQAAFDAAQADVDAAQATVDALVTTNIMISVVDANCLDGWFVDETNRVQEAIALKKGELVAAQQGFDIYTNNLATVTIPTLEATLEGCYTSMTNALAELEQAQANLEKVNEGVYMTFDEFCGSWCCWSDDSVDAHIAYDEYKKEAKVEAENEVKAKSAAYDLAKKEYAKAQEELETKKQELDKAKATGKNKPVEEVEKEIADLEKELAELPGELDFWKSYKYSDDDRDALLKQQDEAEKALAEKEEVRDEAASKLNDAQDVVANQGAVARERLNDLENLLNISLVDANGDALPLEAIRKNVDAYEAKYIEYSKDAENILAAIAQIEKDLEDWSKDPEAQPEAGL